MICNHENKINEYRVVCKDCGVLIFPDILDRMKNIMDYLRMNLDKYDNLETTLSLIESKLEVIEKEVKNGKK